MLTYEGDGVLRAYNGSARELFSRENIREDLVVSRPSHPLSVVVREALAGSAQSSPRLVRFPSGRSYELEISYPSEKGPGRWLVILVEEYREESLPLQVSLEHWGFTDRERAIAEHVVRGAGSDEVCESLGIARSTLKTHLAAIFTKAGVRNRTALIAKLLRT